MSLHNYPHTIALKPKTDAQASFLAYLQHRRTLIISELRDIDKHLIAAGVQKSPTLPKRIR